MLEDWTFESFSPNQVYFEGESLTEKYPEDFQNYLHLNSSKSLSSTNTEETDF